jgi:membrane protein
MPAMARLKDVPDVMKKMGTLPLLKKVWAEVSEDAVFTWAQALAYSWVFALFPLLIATVALVPYLPGDQKQNLKSQVEQTLSTSMGAGPAKDTIKDSINSLLDKPQTGLLSLGLILAIFSASGGMAITMNALDKCYEVKTERSWWKHRLVAIALTVATMILVLAVVVLLPVGTAVLAHFENTRGLGLATKIAINVLRYLVAAGLLAGVVALMYFFGPNIKQKWQSVTPGALLAVAMWIVMGVGFGFYAQNFGNFDKTYGTLGGGILLLLFFYLSSVVLLIGAEVNSVIDFAVLNVKPGCRDFTQPACVEQAERAAGTGGTGQAKDALQPNGGSQAKDALKPDQDEAAKALADAPAFRPDTVPAGPAPAGWWKWAAASVAGAWVAKKVTAPPPDRPRTA